MKNLKQLLERYNTLSTGALGWGGKSYYEMNSDVPLSLNSYGQPKGFILNEKHEVELFELGESYLDWYVEDDEGIKHFISDEQCNVIFAEMGYPDEYVLGIDADVQSSTKKWWGKTLDNYYPHPWYPEKEIVAFEVIRMLPFFTVGDVIEMDEYRVIRSEIDLECFYDIYDCLKYPEFFKPVYI